MKKLLIVLLLISGCASKPPLVVKPPFPDTVDELKVLCPDLAIIPENTTELSDILSIVTDNYAEYKKCKIRVEQWNQWYTDSKKTYDDIK